MAKTVFTLLALVAVSFRYQGVFFARGFTLQSGGYKPGISIPVTKYKREALDTCNPGVESVEEALQRCFADRNINITKILDNPMLFVEIILGQMDVTCSRFDDYRHALECAHNFSSSCVSEDLRDYLFPKFTYISSMMHRLCDNRDYINGKCAVSVYPDLFECLDVKIHNDSQFSDLGDTICFYQELATACVAEEMWRCGCNTTRVLVEIYKEDTRPLLCPPITSVDVPDCSNSTCNNEAEKNIQKCITDQNITFSDFDDDINGVIRMFTSHLEMSCSRFDDYKRALECVHNFTWSCLDEDIRDYVLPKFTYVSSVMQRLCNNREHLDGNCALSVYNNLHTCLNLEDDDDDSSFSDGNVFCWLRELATQCIADKMRICGCMTTRVFIEIYKEDARPPLCPPITSVAIPTCTGTRLTGDHPLGVVLVAAAIVLSLLSAPSSF
ncbi:hypothetical protein C0Q70_20525 [Pomacea canaliculata]|uniref:DUF19 domain-containing protein n=1 Tax=Pomacea canaliculata TaxID=400727 RepID=A0A2T7NFT3_POMCA|nr:hypothetical protein C0Q70_20525 [Pomacea canaliculata]